MDIGILITLGIAVISLMAKFNEFRKKKAEPTVKTDYTDDFFSESSAGFTCEEELPHSAPAPAPACPSASETIFHCADSEEIGSPVPQKSEKKPVDKKKLIIYSEIMKPKYLE